jgi:hypothetical protein
VSVCVVVDELGIIQVGNGRNSPFSINSGGFGRENSITGPSALFMDVDLALDWK